MDREMIHHKIYKEMGKRWAGWQEGCLDDVLSSHFPQFHEKIM